MPGTPKKPTIKKAVKEAAPRAVDKPQYGLGLVTKPQELALPSGAVCLAIRPGAQGLMKMGLLDSLDQLTSLVQVDHIDSKDPRKATKVDIQQLRQDPKKLLEGMEMMDKVIAHVVQEPKVFLDEHDDKGKVKARRVGVIYADMVDEEDKAFIFQWCMGGTADLEKFRAESAELLGGISAGASLPMPTQ